MKFFRIIFISLFLFCSITAKSQDSTVLKELASEYSSAQNDSVRLYLILKVINSTGLDNIDTAIYLSEMGLELAAAQMDTNALKSVNMSLSKFAVARNRYSDALEFDMEALRLAEAINDTLSQTVILNAIGEDYSYLDLYEVAFDYYNRSLNIALERDYELEIAIATYNLGKLYLTTGELEKAKKYLHDSKQTSLLIGDTIGIAYTKNDLALILVEEGNYDSALQELRVAYGISDRLNEDNLTPEIVLSMSKAFVKKGLLNVALIHYNQAFDIYESQSNRGGMATVFYGKGKVSEETKNWSEARNMYNKAIEYAEPIADTELLIKCYEALSGIYENEKRPVEALQYHKKFKHLEDSVFRKKKKVQFEQLQLRLESTKKDAEIKDLNRKEAQQEDEIKQQEFIRNILVVILAFTAVLLFSLYKNNNRRKKINDLLLIQQQEIEAKSKELTSLLEVKDKFFSIVSHDLRSPINSLVGILEILDKDGLTEQELKEMGHALKIRLTSTKKLLDTLLDWAMLQMNEIKITEEEINLSTLVDSNFSFFQDIEEKSIHFKSEVEDSVTVLGDKNMLDLIIRNIISNSIKFTKDGGEVSVSTTKEGDDTLIVVVEDNGVGMSDEQKDKLFDTSKLYTTRGTANEKGTGLGLKLCKEFVERMGGKIWVESTEGKGSIFKFTIRTA